jgi:hypothetical protein
MTNAQGGLLLAYEVVRSIASVYGWPDFHPIARATVRVDPSILATYTGITFPHARIPPGKSGSHATRRWREMDSNPRSPVGTAFFETPPQPGDDKPAR